MPTLSVEQLKAAIVQKLMTVDVPQEDARIVANILSFAEERGVKTHGIMRLPHYIDRIQHGSIHAKPVIQTTALTDTVVKIDGDQALGHLVAYKASEQAIKLADKSGIGVAIVHNTTHSGAIGYYANELAERGYISLIFTQADALVAPFGGRKAMLGANPIAYGIPTGLDYPIVLDMSTSAVSFGKVMLAREADEKIPTTWGMNEAGESTNNPHDVVALHPMAEAKGYGLAILVDVLAGVLAGVAFGQHIEPMYKDVTKPRNLGQLFIVMKPDVFIEAAHFTAQIQQMVQDLQQTPKAPGVDRIYVPGERSYEKAQQAAEQGITISDELYAFLQEEASV